MAKAEVAVWGPCPASSSLKHDWRMDSERTVYCAGCEQEPNQFPHLIGSGPNKGAECVGDFEPVGLAGESTVVRCPVCEREVV